MYSISAVDLFASALGAFILLVMLLFPFYRLAGEANAYSRTLDVMEQRDLAAADIEELKQIERELRATLARMEQDNRTGEQKLARLRARLADIEAQFAAAPEPVAPAAEEQMPEVDIVAPVASEEFSILGIGTAAKSFVIVIDMSGSMLAYADLMIDSVLELLEPLDETNEVAILGFQGDPSPVLWAYPDRSRLLQATPDNLRDMRAFARGLARSFAGSTPTHAAILAAMQYRPDAIILLSDGAPDVNPNFIVQDITQQNRFADVEIHTVAIGDYREDRTLVMFLQSLAHNNGGDFVGVPR